MVLATLTTEKSFPPRQVTKKVRKASLKMARCVLVTQNNAANIPSITSTTKLKLTQASTGTKRLTLTLASTRRLVLVTVTNARFIVLI